MPPALSPPELNALVGLARGVVRGPARRPPFRWWLKRCYLERRSTRAYVAAAFFAVAALSALAVLDGLLAGMHIEGDAAFGVAALSDAGLDPPPVGRPGDVAETWARGTVDGYPEPEHLALAHVFLDTFVFMPAYGWLLGVGLLRLALQFQDHVVIGPPTREERLVQRLARSFRRITVTAFAAVPLLLLVDLIENVLIAGTALECIVSSAPDGCHERPLTYELWAATSVKWLLFAAVAVPLASGLMARELFANGRGLDLGGVLLRLRAVAVIAVVIGMAYLWTATPFAEQAADLLRRWKDESRHAAIAVALTGWWSLLLLLSARCLLERDPSPRGRVPQSALLAAALAGLAIGGLLKWLAGVPGLLVLGGLVLAVWALSELVGPIDDERPTSVAAAFGSAAVPGLLGALPIFVLGLALQRAALLEAVWSSDLWYGAWTVFGLMLQLAAWWIFFAARGGGGPASSAALWFVVGASVLLAAVSCGWVIGDVRGFAVTVGGAGVVAAFAISATALGFLLTWKSDSLVPPSAFRALRLRRIPVLTMLAAWSVGVGFSDREGAYHDAQLAPETRAAHTSERHAEGLGAAFRRWLRDQTGDVQPLVFIAASGGGIRAAYWTAVVLDCIVEGAECGGRPLPAERIFLASGVSGSSLGLAAFAARQREDGSEDWRSTLEGDMLTPTIAWALFIDGPNAFLHANWGPDRARRLEESWEVAWPQAHGEPGGPLGRMLFATAGEEFPLLVLNGTAAESGCRINVSALNLNVDQRRLEGSIEDCIASRALENCIASRALERPARGEPWALATTLDLNLFVCGREDLRLSTAALLSARFPYVSPSGRLRPCRGEAATYAVDGGYFDNTGAETVVELWTALADRIAHANQRGSCIVPVAVAIDNHYDESAGPDPESRPLESLVPLKTFAGGRGAGEANALQELALAMRQPAGPVEGASLDGEILPRFIHLRPRAHPGVQAPLGWALSASSQADLRDQLAGNAPGTDTARSWLDARQLACDRS